MTEKILTGIYLILIGICIGSIFVIGLAEITIFNIDAVFRNNDYTTTLITKYDQGIILSDILEKFKYILVIAATFILIYETLNYRFHKSNFFTWILNLLNTLLMFLFGFLYAPKIASIFHEEPKVMAGPDSESLFNQSELILEILCITLCISFFIRILLMNKNKPN